MVWVDVARVVACILIIANHMAFYSAELYRWIWAEFLAARTPFFLLAAGYFVGRGSFGPLDGGSLFLWRRSWFLLRPYLVWGLVAAVLIGWSPLHEYYASYRPMYEWLEGGEGAGFWPALAAFGRCLGIAGHPVDAPMWFLRDIIIYTAAAPLLYRLGDYLLWVGIIMLSLNYFALDLADHDYPIANSLGFFLLGMYVSRYSLPFLTDRAPVCGAVPAATLALTWWLVGHRDQHNSMLIALGMLGLMSLAICSRSGFRARPDGWRGWPRRASSSSARTTSSSSLCVKAAGLRGRGGLGRPVALPGSGHLRRAGGALFCMKRFARAWFPCWGPTEIAVWCSSGPEKEPRLSLAVKRQIPYSFLC
ncbi:MAG: acyltransferase family protein [Akkermansia sp.]